MEPINPIFRRNQTARR